MKQHTYQPEIKQVNLPLYKTFCGNHSQNHTYMVLKRKILEADGCLKLPVRKLAADCGLGIRQYQRHVKSLVEQGVLIRIHRPKYKRCNDTNLLMLPEVSRKSEEVVCKTNVTQKLKNLNTNTTTPRAGRASCYHRLKWEHNRILNHDPALREAYERRGLAMAPRRCREYLRIAAYNENFRYVPDPEDAKALQREYVEDLKTGKIPWWMDFEDWKTVRQGGAK